MAFGISLFMTPHMDPQDEDEDILFILRGPDIRPGDLDQFRIACMVSLGLSCFSLLLTVSAD